MNLLPSSNQSLRTTGTVNMSGLVDKIKHAVHPTVSPHSPTFLAELVGSSQKHGSIWLEQGTKTVEEVDQDKHNKTHAHEVEEARADTLASKPTFSLQSVSLD